MPKTMIAVPCMDQVSALFAQSLATIRRPGETMVSFLIGSLITDARNSLAKQAISAGADYILWLDSDMTFPPNVLEKMLKHMEEGKDIVSGLYFRRRPPFTPVLFKHLEKGNNVAYDDYPKETVFECDGVGFGCVMMKKEILLDVLLNCGTFFDQIDNYGEDLSFCMRAKEQGYKIYCDSTIKCGHVGQVVVDEEIYQTQIRD